MSKPQRRIRDAERAQKARTYAVHASRCYEKPHPVRTRREMRERIRTPPGSGTWSGTTKPGLQARDFGSLSGKLEMKSRR
jgi:hypothetical protein